MEPHIIELCALWKDPVYKIQFCCFNLICKVMKMSSTFVKRLQKLCDLKVIIAFIRKVYIKLQISYGLLVFSKIIVSRDQIHNKK
jgi:hypothetical protein